MNYYTEAFKKYAVFTGRASRAEYWYFLLFNILISMSLGVIEGILGMGRSDESILGAIYQLVIFIPSISIGVRRMHDVNKSGWFLLVPIYGLILAVSKGDEASNRFGAPPVIN